MANLKAFCAEDLKCGVFLPPFFCAHVGQALRQWEDLVNDQKTLMGRHPMDFRLVEIGSFDDSTGALVSIKAHVVSGPGELVKGLVPEIPAGVHSRDLTEAQKSRLRGQPSKLGRKSALEDLDYLNGDL